MTEKDKIFRHKDDDTGVSSPIEHLPRSSEPSGVDAVVSNVTSDLSALLEEESTPLTTQEVRVSRLADLLLTSWTIALEESESEGREE